MMIGVKRPLKLGTPKPPKSAKKKKALKQPPKPDVDDATVIANPYVDYMQQKPSEAIRTRPDELMAPPFTEGDVPNAEQMVSPTKPIPSQLELVGQMKGRYRMLLQQAKPDELAEGQAPSLPYLEDKYGHLVEKGFWYDRVVKLASTYVEIGQGEKKVWDLNHADLEEAVRHLVPFTEEEKEYQQLMENYKQSKVQIDGIPTLEFLRRHHANPPKAENLSDITKAALEDFLDEDQTVTEALNVDNRYVPNEACPIHEDKAMKCLNTDEVCGQQLVAIGLDRFKKDDVKVYPAEERWWGIKHPSPCPPPEKRRENPGETSQSL